MKPFKRVAIIGIGLIGGSIALALKKKRLAASIVGISRSAATVRRCLKDRIVDYASRDLNEAAGADLIIVAAPVDVILDIARPLSGIVSRDCLVTDVGSTKKVIVSSYEKLFPRYVGSHPLAGSEKKGAAFADPGLFIGSVCITCPTPKTLPAAHDTIQRLWRALGAKIVRLSPAYHDRVLSFVSHLPHAVAFSLVSAVPKAYVRLGSGGLRDTTRIAASDSHLWNSIFLTNSGNLLTAIDDFQHRLSALRGAIRRKDKYRLYTWLRQAQRKRQSYRDCGY